MVFNNHFNYTYQEIPLKTRLEICRKPISETISALKEKCELYIERYERFEDWKRTRKCKKIEYCINIVLILISLSVGSIFYKCKQNDLISNSDFVVAEVLWAMGVMLFFVCFCTGRYSESTDCYPKQNELSYESNDPVRNLPYKRGETQIGSIKEHITKLNLFSNPLFLNLANEYLAFYEVNMVHSVSLPNTLEERIRQYKEIVYPNAYKLIRENRFDCIYHLFEDYEKDKSNKRDLSTNLLLEFKLPNVLIELIFSYLNHTIDTVSDIPIEYFLLNSDINKLLKHDPYSPYAHMLKQKMPLLQNIDNKNADEVIVEVNQHQEYKEDDENAYLV